MERFPLPSLRFFFLNFPFLPCVLEIELMWSCLVAGIFPHWAILLALFHYSFDTFIHFDDGICCFLPCFPLSSSSLSYRNPYSQQVPSTPSRLLLLCDPLSLSMSWTSVAPPWFLMKYCWVQFCADHLHLQWVREFIGCVMFLRCLSVAYLSILWLLYCLCLFLNNIPCLVEGVIQLFHLGQNAPPSRILNTSSSYGFQH